MKVCPICEKGSRIVGRRVALRATRYNPTKKSRKYPNLQWAFLLSGERVKICAKCLKKNKQLEIKTKIINKKIKI